jgi:hypothetical protein
MDGEQSKRISIVPTKLQWYLQTLCQTQTQSLANDDVYFAEADIFEPATIPLPGSPLSDAIFSRSDSSNATHRDHGFLPLNERIKEKETGKIDTPACFSKP